MKHLLQNLHIHRLVKCGFSNYDPKNRVNYLEKPLNALQSRREYQARDYYYTH